MYLVWFNGVGELRGEEQVLLVSWVVDIDQHSSLSVWLIEAVVHMWPAALLCARSDREILIVVFLAAYLQGIFITWTQLDHIWRNTNEQRYLNHNLLLNIHTHIHIHIFKYNIFSYIHTHIYFTWNYSKLINTRAYKLNQYLTSNIDILLLLLTKHTYRWFLL